MLFRFSVAILLVVMIAAGGITLERRILDMRRAQALQLYRLTLLEEKYARLKLRCQELNAPQTWTEPKRMADSPLAPTRKR